MAKPIKETPILKGKDAQRFISQHNKSKDAVALKKEKERILLNYKKLQSAESFH